MQREPEYSLDPRMCMQPTCVSADNVKRGEWGTSTASASDSPNPIAIFKTKCKSATYLQDNVAFTDIYGLQGEQRGKHHRNI
jgi:hypothetical protein